ncbi:nicotianamine synthase family protein [Serpentinicella alkaliphila]|uniref:Nicotianamine synthase-like protein n=1 Tax=Serpentinicella alkaliphila TaxID=1734049 RepID=A0A4R2U6U6_9FIRM|nr:nicotianamine synthase family protein [Serpentinicella alkaliphila]QUH24824.1 hypothetical protein HZR23_02805 [Serpentinicella alkaliphila]TCQ03473.1 nicotianamine synthase-like protein [Serpentinicella alkaliphila]
MDLVSVFTKKLEILSSFFPGLIGFYKWYYEKIVDEEISLGCISENDRVLVIGGGPFPCTAIEIARKTKAKIHIVDKDPVAVNSACNLIKKLNLEKQICITCTQGQEVDTEDYSVIHVAQQVYPKEAVLVNLLKKTKIGTRILLRSRARGLDSFYNRNCNLCLATDCKEIKQGKYSEKRTFLITKLGRGNEDEVKIKKDNTISDRAHNDIRDIKAC